MNAGLLGSVLIVASCSEDVIINNGTEGLENFAPDSKELTQYTVTASIQQPELVARANIQEDGKYVWNAGDTITLWNRNIGKGYDFAIVSSYNDASKSETADFEGKAYFENEHKIVAVYPKMTDVVFNEWGTISLPAIYSQSGTVSDVASFTYMMASGKFSNGQISALEFVPLTALVDFHITNVSDATLKLYELVLEADKDVFPTEIKVNESGNVTGYAGMGKTLTLNLNEQELAPQAVLDGYINTLPTAYGDTRLITDDTKFTLSIKVWNGTSEQTIKPFANVTMHELADVLGFDTSTTGNQLKAGSRYNMNINLEYRTVVPAEGYVVDEFGNIQIYNIKGLYGWNQVAANYPQADITLETRTEGLVFEDGSATDFDLANKEINLDGKDEWTPVSIIYGTFDGNGFTIKNITIKEKGFIENNSGTIKNLTFDAPQVTNLNQSTGTVVMTNSGTLSNCHVKNADWTIQGNKDAYVGFLASDMGNKAVTEKCSVTDSELTANVVAKASPSFAGLIGKNAQGTVIDCFVNNVTISTNQASGYDNTPDIGGLVAYLDRGFIKASYAISTMTLNTPANAGGLTGRVNGGTILASYSGGQITSSYQNGKWQSTAGCVGKIAGGKVIGCYTTSAVHYNGQNSLNTGVFCGINSGECKETYYTSEGSSPAGEKVDMAGLVSKARLMNMAVREVDANIGFGFFKNEDAATSTAQPLVLGPLEGNIPGFDAPDFGDGGDI